MPGALLRVLEPLARHEINMSKLESRPADEPWHYHFFLELDHAAGDPQLAAAIGELRGVTESLRVLGTYARSVANPTPPALRLGYIHSLSPMLHDCRSGRGRSSVGISQPTRFSSRSKL